MSPVALGFSYSRADLRLLGRLRRGDFGVAPAKPLMVGGGLGLGGDPEARILLDFRGHRSDPAVAVVVARVRILRMVSRDETVDLAVHPDAESCHGKQIYKRADFQAPTL